MAVRSAPRWVALKVASTVLCWAARSAVMMVDYDGVKGINVDEYVCLKSDESENVLVLDKSKQIDKKGLDYVEGCCEGRPLGCSLGCVLGSALGCIEGCIDGCVLGCNDGSDVGCSDGQALG